MLVKFNKHLKEKTEDTNGVIRCRKSKDRQHNRQKNKDKRTNNDLYNTTQKTKGRVTRIKLKTEDEHKIISVI